MQRLNLSSMTSYCYALYYGGGLILLALFVLVLAHRLPSPVTFPPPKGSLQSSERLSYFGRMLINPAAVGSW